MFTISQKIQVIVKEIDLEKRRISLSHKDTIANPWKEFGNKFPVGSKISGKIKNIADFGLFVSLKDYDLEGLVHYKDLSYSGTESDLKNYSKNQELKLKILEIDSQKEKIRLGLKQLMLDPLEYFRGKSKKDIITVTVKEISENAIKVSPDGCDLKFLIRKAQIAVDKQDQRVTRFTKGDRLDVMIQECDIEKRKISLSIKMLEEEETKTAIKKYGSVDSGKSLPFADLPSALKKKKTNKEK
jgi:small subunit ribosomal protein S1